MVYESKICNVFATAIGEWALVRGAIEHSERHGAVSGLKAYFDARTEITNKSINETTWQVYSRALNIFRP